MNYRCWDKWDEWDKPCLCIYAIYGNTEMNADYAIISTTTATSGWWLMYDDENKQFYYPIAAWAKCATPLNDGSEYIHNEWLYPMTPDTRNLLHVPVLDGAIILYLPDSRFAPVIGNGGVYYTPEGAQK